MPRNRLLIFLICAMLLLAGCWDSVEIDDQCFLLFLAIDRTEKGGIQLTSEIPSVNSEPAGGGGDETANMFTVAGRDLFTAMDIVYASHPLNVNLSQLKVIIVSEEIAKEESFGALLNDLLSLRGIRRMAYIVVCEGRAIDFAENFKATASTQLSKSMEIALTAYLNSSYQVQSRLLELYNQMRNIHGTGIAASGAVLEKYESGVEMDIAGDDTLQPGDVYAAELPHRGLVTAEVFGTALFSRTQMKMKLTGHETLLLCFLRGEGKQNIISVPATNIDQSYELSDTQEYLDIIIREKTKPKLKVMENGDGAYTFVIDVSIEATLTKYSGGEEQMAMLEWETWNVFQRDSQALLEKMQSEGLDPLGFHSVMARKFTTIDEWEAFNWDSAYRNGNIQLNTSVDLLRPSKEPGGLPVYFR